MLPSILVLLQILLCPTCEEGSFESFYLLSPNRANAQLSSGPLSPEGKLKSSHNAVKTALTGQTVLLPSDDVAAYNAHIVRTVDQYAPATDAERILVQTIADTEWRLFRIPSLEAGIRSVARLKLAHLFPEIDDPALRASFLEGEIQLTYNKDLSNLALQESRLVRRRQATIEELEKLQAPRKEKEATTCNMREALRLRTLAVCARRDFLPELFGFVFTPQEVEEAAELENFKNEMIGYTLSLSKEEYKKRFEQYRAKYDRLRDSESVERASWWPNLNAPSPPRKSTIMH